jgi:LysR family transcriptional regulator, low CO2-responsive transcriptional regulator
MRRYTLRQLDTFAEVARHASVSAAAQALHITQPAVSMQLRQLEQALGVPLVQQVGRRIELTAAGTELERLALAALAPLKDMDDAFASRRSLRRGTVDLAVVSTAKYFIPMLLVAFRRKHPGIDVRLRLDNREGVLGVLERNEVDLIVMGRAPDSIACVARPFASNPMAIVAAPSHPLSRRKRAPLALFKGQEFVVREAGSGTRAAMERLFAQARLKPKVVMEMPSNETIKQAVMAGMGLAFLSLRTVRHELASGRLVLLDVQGLPVMRQWFVTHRESKRLAPAAMAFEQFLVEEAGPLVETWC